MFRPSNLPPVLVLLLAWVLASSAVLASGWGFLLSTKPCRERASVVVVRGGDQDGNPLAAPQHQVVSEDILHSGKWRSLKSRRVQLPSGNQADFELMSQQGTDQAVLIFVWNSTSQTATMIREYMPSMHDMRMGLAAGMVDDKHSADSEEKASSIYTAAQFELEEECRLQGGQWHLLVANAYMDKYSTTRLSVYLVLDPQPVDEASAKPRDDMEEGMQVVSGVSLDQLREWMRSGQMTVVASWACLLVLDRLQELGEVQ